MPERYFTLAEVAERLGFSERKLRRIIKQRSIPVLVAGRDIRFDMPAIIALEEALRRPGSKPSSYAEALRLTQVESSATDDPKIFVYFIGAASAIKIGRSADPEGRLAELQIGSSEKLELLAIVPGGSRRERALHRRFERHRLRGEWFRRSDELIRYVGLLKTRCRRGG